MDVKECCLFMSISVKTQKMLWGRSANRCAFSECRRELVIDSIETDDESLVGDACHMVGDSQNGPRGESFLSDEDRDKYGNLVLLCKVHHKMIDDQRNYYTVERLQEMKRHHESWVAQTLQGYNAIKQREDEYYASVVDEWSRRSDLSNWEGWTSNLLGAGQPHLYIVRDEALAELGSWILSRVWPSTYLELESAFENFRRVLQDLYHNFHKYAKREHDMFWTEKSTSMDMVSLS